MPRQSVNASTKEKPAKTTEWQLVPRNVFDRLESGVKTNVKNYNNKKRIGNLEFQLKEGKESCSREKPSFSTVPTISES